MLVAIKPVRMMAPQNIHNLNAFLDSSAFEHIVDTLSSNSCYFAFFFTTYTFYYFN